MTILDFIIKKSIFLIFISIFLLGWLSNSLYANIGGLDFAQPFSFSLFKPKELNSPFNHIQKEQIHVFNDKIILDIPNARWAEFTNTNSMDPLLDEDANSFEIIPTSPSDIHIGDIIVYQPNTFDGLIVHRVIEIGMDGDGWYAVAKGDNLKRADPEKIRFNQIQGILVGIIY